MCISVIPTLHLFKLRMRKINKYNYIYTTGLSHDSRNKVGAIWAVHDAKKNGIQVFFHCVEFANR